MTEDEHSLGEQALALAAKALVGAPAAVLANAVKVISRLVGTVGGIPEAWVKAKVQRIHDDADARSAVVKAVSKVAAKQAAADPAIIDRGLERWAGDLIRNQTNREAVAALTVGELDKISDGSASTDSSATEEQLQVDDDWLNAFSRFTEDASTERMRVLWARVAAGEIRKPGSFSLATLRLVSEIDQGTAKDFERALAHIVGDCIPINDAWQIGELYTLALRMQARGLFLNPPGQTSRKIIVEENGYGVFFGKKQAIIAKAAPGTVKEVDIIVLSSEAIELAMLLTLPSEIDVLTALAENLNKSDLVD